VSIVPLDARWPRRAWQGGYGLLEPRIEQVCHVGFGAELDTLAAVLPRDTSEGVQVVKGLRPGVA
jgi:hypothetical protein